MSTTTTNNTLTKDQYMSGLKPDNLHLYKLLGDRLINKGFVYKVAVQKYGWDLEFVLEKYRTEDLCKTAVQRDGMALQWVPEKYRTLEICKEAVQHEGRALRWVPNKYRAEDLCDHIICYRNDPRL